MADPIHLESIRKADCLSWQQDSALVLQTTVVLYSKGTGLTQSWPFSTMAAEHHASFCSSFPETGSACLSGSV
eukprot:326936-Pelagomonas_calceolata.AAC.2